MSTRDEIAIKVTNVSKTFKLPHEKNSSIKSLVLHPFKKRSFEKQQVLNDINFEIKKGEFFGIVGRNGSGKSTLLKLLAGIYSPDKGHIQVNGKLTPFIELGVGFNPELTGRENVFLNGALLGFNRKEMLEMYDEIVEFAEIEKFMDQKLKNYSSGMQVRLAFSIAIRANTEILLLDEVLAVGDAAFQQKCYSYFAKLKQQKKTIVLVTHDMSVVERFCDKVLIIDKGENSGAILKVRDAVKIYNRVNQEDGSQKSNAKNNKSAQNKDIFIKDVTLSSDNGMSKKIFSQGEELVVTVQIGKSENVSKSKKLTIGLAFHDIDNTLIAGPNSIGEEFTSDTEFMIYSIPKIPFNYGKYYLTIAVYDEYVSKLYDLIDKEIVFSVATEQTHYGKIVLEDNWGVNKNA